LQQSQVFQPCSLQTISNTCQFFHHIHRFVNANS
jgi:hypothetical protein